MSDLYIEARLQAIKDIASASCADIKDADNIASFCDEIYSAIPNLDKVVEELQEFLINYGVSEKSNVHQRIIEIVKQGGVSNDVCEWRVVDKPQNLPIYNTSCGKIRMQYTPEVDIYCNGCGKKIKVIQNDN